MTPIRFVGPLVALAAIAGCADVPTAAPAQVDPYASTKALDRLPRAPGDRVAVAIVEFRSTVAEIPARGTTDLFTTALVRSGQFRVVERARVNEGVIREKQLNGAGLTKGKSAQTPLTDARYLFEGAVTEASIGETQRNGAFAVAGMQVGGGRGRDVVGIDVRVVDVETGEVVDVVTVRKPIASDDASVSGVGNLVGTVLARKGRDPTFVPDAQYQQQRKEGVDVALRAAIDQAVVALAGRLGR